MADRFELFVNGKELANAYSELNDPQEQLLRFQHQVQVRSRTRQEGGGCNVSGLGLQPRGKQMGAVFVNFLS